MVEEPKIKRTYVVTQSVAEKLEALANAYRRDMSAQLCVLVEQAYAEMKGKQARPSR